MLLHKDIAKGCNLYYDFYIQIFTFPHKQGSSWINFNMYNNNISLGAMIFFYIKNN